MIIKVLYFRFIIYTVFSILLLSNTLLINQLIFNDNNNIFDIIDIEVKNSYAQEFDINDDEFDYIFDPGDYIEDESSNDYFIDGDLEQKNIDDDIGFIDGDLEQKNIDDKNKSLSELDFSFAAVGDWACKSEAEDTTENIIEQDPDLVIALGDLSYNGKPKCWLEIIEPIAEKTKIVIGNHETDSSKQLDTYMDVFNLENEFYSFNYGNVHFLVLSTETKFKKNSPQYEFVVQDLEKYSNDPTINFIISFFHRQIYSSGSSLDDEEDFREVYHPLFDKYGVDLAMAGHLHVYERSFPILYNDDDDDEPIITDQNPNFYKNHEGTIFLIVGTGGAHDMQLSKSKPYSAIGIDGEFGILNVDIRNNGTELIGTFIDNGKKKEVLDKFRVIKDIT